MLFTCRDKFQAVLGIIHSQLLDISTYTNGFSKPEFSGNVEVDTAYSERIQKSYRQQSSSLILSILCQLEYLITRDVITVFRASWRFVFNLSFFFLCPSHTLKVIPKVITSSCLSRGSFRILVQSGVYSGGFSSIPLYAYLLVWMVMSEWYRKIRSCTHYLQFWLFFQNDGSCSSVYHEWKRIWECCRVFEGS